MRKVRKDYSQALAGYEDLARIADRLIDCGRELEVRLSATGRAKLTPTICNVPLTSLHQSTRFYPCNYHKLCPLCARKRTGQTLSQTFPLLESAMARGQYIYGITCTVPHSPTEGLDMVFGRIKYFMHLLSNYWKTSKRGKTAYNWSPEGAQICIEIKRSNDGGWHPHAHILTIENQEMNYGETHKIIGRLTDWTSKSNHFVRLRKISDAVEFCKYSIKFTPFTAIDLWEIIKCTHRAHMRMRTGIFRKLPENESEIKPPIVTLQLKGEKYVVKKNDGDEARKISDQQWDDFRGLAGQGPYFSL